MSGSVDVSPMPTSLAVKWEITNLTFITIKTVTKLLDRLDII